MVRLLLNLKRERLLKIGCNDCQTSLQAVSAASHEISCLHQQSPTSLFPLTSTVWRDQNFDRYRDRDFLSETNFSDTNTETFFRDQIFRDRYRDFFSETKFSNTDTETFLTRPNFSIPIPRLFFRDQNFWYRYRDSQKIVTGLETETETETFAYDWQLTTDNF